MKKRIIGMILVIVTVLLSFASCGYNYTKDDLSQYATFDKEAFAAALKTLEIEDGDFTLDKETREKKVLDKIYSTLATNSDKTVKKTEGVIGEHDLLYYCYYVTFELDGKTIQLAPDYMKTAKAVSLQLGSQFPTDLQAAILEAIAGYDFTDSAYSQKTSLKAEVKDDPETEADEAKPAEKLEDGMVVFLTYTYSYEEGEGEEAKTVTDTITLKRVVLDSSDPFHAKLIENNKVNSTTNFDIEDDELGTVKYTKVKIDWIEQGKELTTFTEITHPAVDDTTKKEMTDVEGNKHNVAGVELTYHVYPVNFVEVLDFTAENVIEKVYGKSLSYELIKAMLFGKKYTLVEMNELEEDEKKAVEAELEELVAAYKTKVGDVELTFSEFVETLTKALTDFATAQSTLDQMEDDLAEAEEKEASAKIKAEKTDATEADKAEYDQAKKNTETAKKAVENAKTEHEKAVKTRDEKVDAFFAIKDTMKDDIVAGYKNVTYNTLQTTYNSDIETHIGAAVYELMTSKDILKYTGKLPEKAVKEAYDQMIENYEHAFYNNEKLEGDTTNTNKDETFYHLYKGSFKQFLINYAVPVALGTKPTNIDEAYAAIRKQAEEYVKPVVAIYVVAEAYDVVISDKEFKKMAKEDVNYTYNEGVYGKNTVRNAYQFDAILEILLKSEESVDAEDSRFESNKYPNIWEGGSYADHIKAEDEESHS